MTCVVAAPGCSSVCSLYSATTLLLPPSFFMPLFLSPLLPPSILALCASSLPGHVHTFALSALAAFSSHHGVTFVTSASCLSPNGDAILVQSRRSRGDLGAIYAHLRAARQFLSTHRLLAAPALISIRPWPVTTRNAVSC